MLVWLRAQVCTPEVAYGSGQLEYPQLVDTLSTSTNPL